MYEIYEIYKKYLLYTNIKKLIAYKSKLKFSYTLWYHELFDNNWTLDSYKKIYTFSNIAEFWILYNNHICLNNGMYFIMKNNIKPLYEDKKNKNGGYWSIKIPQSKIKTIWLYLLLDLIGGSLDNKNIVNGLSLVYKKKFYIIKIWIKNVTYKDIENLNINLDIDKNDILFNNF